uniref:Phosphoprotein n=1 Tax=Caenorhabditis tropicalis TaxID=1561998 RepID=A0A1I7UWH9_9PELO
MSFMNKVEDSLSSAYVEHKLDPLDKPAQHYEAPQEPQEHHSGHHRLSDAFMTLKDSILGDTCHKTGEAFNDPDEEEDKMMDDKRKMSESKDM